MFDFAFLWGGLVAATFIPAYAALYLLPALGLRTKYIAAFGTGLTFWFFYDTMGDAASLGENNSIFPAYLFGGVPHLALIGAFVLGILVLAAFDHLAVPRSGETPGRRAVFLIPASIALVMGIHGLGEGWGAVSAVSSAPSVGTTLQALIQAFGSFPALVSYPIHKFLEATIIAIVYGVYLRGEGTRAAWWEVPVLGFLFAGPSAVGAAIGFFYSADTTYFFAFGVTAALYAVLRLFVPIAQRGDRGPVTPVRYGPVIVVLLGLGMLLLYTAALLH